MVDRAKLNVSEKLDLLMQACNYASDRELAGALGESAQNVGNWRKRNTYGQAGEDKLHDLTNVSIDWLRGRSEIPFPSGAPRLNPNQSIGRLATDIDQIRKSLLEFARALASTTPALALAWKAGLEDAASPYYIERGFHGALLSVLDTFADSGEAAQQAVPEPEARAASRRKASK